MIFFFLHTVFVPSCFLFQLVIASVVVGTLSVTGLAYLDLRSQINEKQSQLNDINTKMAAQDDMIATLTSSVSALSVRLDFFSSHFPSRIFRCVCGCGFHLFPPCDFLEFTSHEINPTISLIQHILTNLQSHTSESKEVFAGHF